MLRQRAVDLGVGMIPSANLSFAKEMKLGEMDVWVLNTGWNRIS